MRNAISFSIFLHTAVFLIGYIGMPYMQPTPVISETPILVEIVNVDQKTNVAPPLPKIDKKVKAKNEEQSKKLSLQKSTAVLSPKAMTEEVLPIPQETKPKFKPKFKPKVKNKIKEIKSKNTRKLAKVKPRRKPKPPNSFESVLKTLEKLKSKSNYSDKKKEKKEKTKNFEQQVAQALLSHPKNHNPLRKLAISEIDLVRQQIRECWSLPAGAREAENLSIEIKMAMNSDGTVQKARIIDQGRLKSDPFFRAAAESALRAVLNPRCNPLKLPPEKFRQWQNMTLIFDPQKMF